MLLFPFSAFFYPSVVIVYGITLILSTPISIQSHSKIPVVRVWCPSEALASAGPCFHRLPAPLCALTGSQTIPSQVPPEKPFPPLWRLWFSGQIKSVPPVPGSPSIRYFPESVHLLYEAGSKNCSGQGTVPESAEDGRSGP